MDSISFYPEYILDLAFVVKRFKMYPYFDIANYILMCVSVREENIKTVENVTFHRLHPLACWFGSMLLCFAGGILGNILLGEPLITPLLNDHEVLTATVVWYLVNYAPFDCIYKLCKLTPVKSIVCLLKEIQRTNKVHHGVLFALRNFPGSYILVCLFGVLKGSASQQMKIFQRLICGVWQPSSSDILKPSIVTKGSLIASVVFVLEHKGFIDLPGDVLYLSVICAFWILRLLTAFGIDPFLPFENLFCSVFMGGLVDSLKRATERSEDTSPLAAPGNAPRNNVKAKDE